MKKLGTPQGTTTGGEATKCENVDKHNWNYSEESKQTTWCHRYHFYHRGGGGELQTFKKTDEMIMEIKEN